MKNRELYVKDPGAIRLLNNGVAEVAEIDTEALRQTLRFELETFVCKGEYQRGLLVGTGQSALHDTPLLQKIAGRFPTRLHLSDTDVETVTREMILLKKPDRVPTVKQILDECDGEVSRHLRETDIGPRTEDRDFLAADYPLLPVRRRFWENCLRAVDPGGTAAQLRTQLRIVFEAAKATADAPVGTVIAGDFIYGQIAQDLLQSGVLLREIHEAIEEHRKGGADGELRARLCSLIYLIGRLPREQGADVGLRANTDALGDLLVEDLQAGSAQLRNQVSASLEQMNETGKLMRIVKQRLAELKAAQETLDVRGEPSSGPGKEARRAMETRKSSAESNLELVLTAIFKQTRVFQGGGTEIDGVSLAEKVETAAGSSLARLFTKFNYADDARWDQVLRKGRQGDANALETVDYQGEVAKHPVCSGILGYVGSGKKGRDVRGEFAGAPYAGLRMPWTPAWSYSR